jgi:hypothetical protein
VASKLLRFRRWLKALVDSVWAPQRMEITIQTDRLYIIRQRRSRRVWCEQCGCRVNAVSLQQAGSLASAAQPILPGNAESEAWHICTGENGEQLFCLDSLLNSIGSDGEM